MYDAANLRTGPIDVTRTPDPARSPVDVAVLGDREGGADQILVAALWRGSAPPDLRHYYGTLGSLGDTPHLTEPVPSDVRIRSMPPSNRYDRPFFPRQPIHVRNSGRTAHVSILMPCVQCLGATHWAGVSRLVCGATVEAAQAAGFDEGPRSDDWQAQLEARGTAVVCGEQSGAAAAVLAEYVARGGFRYNARGS